jgi:serine/threonine-protein kinase
MLPGEVFATFDAQDSGNVSYGVRIGERRYFVKTPGRVDDPEHATRVTWLRNAVEIATSCAHRALSVLDHVIESDEGPLLVYDWFDGELLGVPSARRNDPASSFARCQRPRSRQPSRRSMNCTSNSHVLAGSPWTSTTAACCTTSRRRSCE